MKRFIKALAVLISLSVILLCFFACVKTDNPSDTSASSEKPGTADKVTDYAAAAKLDFSSDTLKAEVTVKSFIDGDTTHFIVPMNIVPDGVLKARYLAINTPESTGKIEEYGKKASEFTKEKLSSASSIIIESDDGTWNLDSTGGRYLVWVWYRTDGNSQYRNLNIEILQNGLAIASSSSSNRYGEICVAAISSAKAQKLCLYSGQKDPDFYYGEALELTLKELRCNIEKYNGVKVAFSGVITVNDGGGVYIEDYDSETDMYYGIYIYYGYGLTGEGLDVLSVGNLSRIVGTVQYFETGGTYQVSGLTYRLMKPDDPGNIKKLGDGYKPAYVPLEARTFSDGEVTVETDDGTPVTFGYAELAVSTSVSIENLSVESVYTTGGSGDSGGAMTLTCRSGDITVTVRTVVLRDSGGSIVKKDAYEGKNISVRGIIDYYQGTYQIKVFSTSDITVNG